MLLLRTDHGPEAGMTTEIAEAAGCAPDISPAQPGPEHYVFNADLRPVRAAPLPSIPLRHASGGDMPRNTLTRRLRNLWRFLRNPADRIEWAWLRYPWFGEGQDTPLPVIVAQLRAGLKALWDARDRVKELEDRVTTLELELLQYPEEEGRMPRRSGKPKR